MKNLLKIVIASALVLGYTAVAAGGSAFGGGITNVIKSSCHTLVAGTPGSAFGGG